MKLLFDENLSPVLVPELIDAFPDSVHVREAGLATATDVEVWDYAASHDLPIVSKDSDFRQRSFLLGPPPKVVWVKLGNCTTVEIAALLRIRAAEIQAFHAEPETAFLALELAR